MRPLLLAFTFLLIGQLLAIGASAQSPEVTTPAGAGAIFHLTLDSPIHPMSARLVEMAIERAENEGAAALVIELDTPGGSLPATRRLCRALLASPVPVLVYVSPGGAQAASAGFFLLMAADLAAMAPGTNTGAAHPVAGGGQDLEGEMGEKVLQDTLALVRALAEQRNRDPELAQAAVRDSRSWTASEALVDGLIDFVEPDLSSLLAAAHGHQVPRPSGDLRLDTAGAEVERVTMSAEQRLLAALAHPQIAGLLMAFGLLGLYAEISNPGLIFPGVIGAICLLLGFFAMSVLPVDYAGMALLLLALVLFVAETQVPTFGVLTLGGAVALGLGLTMLADEMDPSLRPNPWWPVATAALVALVAGAASLTTVRSRRRAPVSGQEGMIGAPGVVRRALDPAGTVTVHGEIWRAVAPEPLDEGTPVVVTALDGLTLSVRAAEGDDPPDEDDGARIEARRRGIGEGGRDERREDTGRRGTEPAATH